MKSIRVIDVCYQSMRALIVHQDTPLEVAVRKFATDYDLRGIFLADDDGRLTGVLNYHDLLNWTRLQFDLPARHDSLSLAHARRLMLAERVRDLATPGSSETAVYLNDNIGAALDKMTQFNLVDIPVLDERGRIVADLRLAEILSYILTED